MRSAQTWRRIVGLCLAMLVPKGALESQAPTIQLSPVATIGSLDGPDAYVFGHIGQVAIGPDERMYVVDSRMQRVQVYDSAGLHHATIGRRGYGPGEFQSPWRIAVTSEGSIVVRDLDLQRYQVYDGSGAYKRALPAPNDQTYWDLLRSDGHGRVWDARRTWADSVSSHHVHSFSPAVDSRALMGPLEIPRWTRSMVSLPDGAGYVDQPFFPGYHWAVSPQGDVWTTTGAEYLLRRSSGDGAATIRRAPVRVRIPDQARDTALARAREAVRSRLAGTRHDPAEFMRQIRTPDHYPPINALAMDRRGRFWVGVPGPEGPALFDVLSPSGEMIARVAFTSPAPLRVDLIVFGRRHIVVPWEEESGVQGLAIYEMPDGWWAP